MRIYFDAFSIYIRSIIISPYSAGYWHCSVFSIILGAFQTEWICVYGGLENADRSVPGNLKYCKAR